jgi:hypothetical protein
MPGAIELSQFDINDVLPDPGRRRGETSHAEA